MDSNKKIMVKNETKGLVSINIPSLMFRREWAGKDTVRPITFGELEQIYFEPGVEYMFTQGMLSIDDKEARVALGLEGEDAVIEVVQFSDEIKANYLKNKPVPEFRQALKELSKEQIDMLVEYAIDNEIINVDKCQILKTATGVDIMKAIQLKKQAEEA